MPSKVQETTENIEIIIFLKGASEGISRKWRDNL